MENHQIVSREEWLAARKNTWPKKRNLRACAISFCQGIDNSDDFSQQLFTIQALTPFFHLCYRRNPTKSYQNRIIRSCAASFPSIRHG